MQEILSLVDAIVQEHTRLLSDVRRSTRIANDLGTFFKLEKASSGFEPKKLENRMQSLQNLKEVLETVNKELGAHFYHEEKVLIPACEEYKHKHQMFSCALSSLLDEHEGIMTRIDVSKRHVNELLTGDLSQELWEGQAYGMKIYLDHTTSLLKEHARSEEELFRMLRKGLE